MKAFLNRLWSRRYVRILSWGFVSLAVLFILATALINWSGQRRWLRVKADFEQQGETLAFKSVLSTPIPDERNFAAIEPLRGINVVENGDDTQGPSGKKRQALKTFGAARPEKLHLPWHGVAFAQKTDFKEGATSSAALRQRIEASAGPLLKALTEAARQRPEAEFVPAWRDQALPPNFFTLQIPHYTSAMDAAKVLALHGLACADSGDAAAGTGDALAILRFVQACSREPLLIGHLMTIGLFDESQDLIWTLLEHRQMTEPDLNLLQQSLRETDFEGMLLATLRGELATSVSAITDLETQGWRRPYLITGNLSDSHPSLLASVMGALIPKGFFAHNKATMVDIQLRLVLQPLKQEGLKALLKQDDPLQRIITEHSLWTRPDILTTKMLIPIISIIVRKTAVAESRRRQGLIACALERFHLQRQSYPAQLTELVPAFLDAVPADLIDDQPMRYRRSEKGRYLLWSIAFDGKDDNGKVTRASKEALSSQLSHLDYEGDWTWQYEPVK